MKIVDKISVKELKELAKNIYGDIIKADVDVVKRILIVDMEWHADGEAELLKKGSKQTDLWGINLYPEKFGRSDFIEFDSMINLKPRQNNRTRSVEDPEIRKQITDIVNEVVHE